MIFEASLELCLISPSAVMLKRQLFDRVGYFDESLPACEDYDLWLRISSRFPVHLIDEPLLIKTGGHPDQLSRMTGLDKYRIHSICKIMQSGELTSKQYQAALEVLQKKCAIYAQGCRRRGKVKEAEKYLSLAASFNEQ